MLISEAEPSLLIKLCDAINVCMSRITRKPLQQLSQNLPSVVNLIRLFEVSWRLNLSASYNLETGNAKPEKMCASLKLLLVVNICRPASFPRGPKFIDLKISLTLRFELNKAYQRYCSVFCKICHEAQLSCPLSPLNAVYVSARCGQLETQGKQHDSTCLIFPER